MPGRLHLGRYRVRNAVAVQNFMGSGATFVQSLLDGHPAILSTPALNSRTIYHFWESQRNLAPLELIAAFTQHHRHWFDPKFADRDNALHRLGPDRSQCAVIDPRQFLKAMVALVGREATIDRRSFLEACHIAYALAGGRSLESELLLLFPVHTLQKQYAGYLLEDYPGARFLYTLRDPISLFNSLLRRHIELAYDTRHPMPLAQFTHMLRNRALITGETDFCGDRPYFPERADQFRGIRIEDLHRAPRQVLEAVCGWLGIDGHPCLLESTFDGKMWWNKISSRSISGFNPDFHSRDRHLHIGPLDRPRLRHLLRTRREAWSYAAPRRDAAVADAIAFWSGLWLPFKIELTRGPSRLRAVALASRLARRLPSVAAELHRERLAEETLATQRMANHLLYQLDAAVGPARSAHAVATYRANGAVELDVVAAYDDGRPSRLEFKRDPADLPATAAARLARRLVSLARLPLWCADYWATRSSLIAGLREALEPSGYVVPLVVIRD